MTRLLSAAYPGRFAGVESAITAFSKVVSLLFSTKAMFVLLSIPAPLKGMSKVDQTNGIFTTPLSNTLLLWLPIPHHHSTYLWHYYTSDKASPSQRR